MQDDATQILSEIKRLAKQFLTLEGYTPIQTIVEDELLPVVDKSQQALGGGDQDLDSSKEEAQSMTGDERLDFGRARSKALADVKDTGQYGKVTITVGQGD